MTQISGNVLPACGSGGCLAVFGVLYDFAPDEATRSAFLAPLIRNLPVSSGHVVSPCFPSRYPCISEPPLSWQKLCEVIEVVTSISNPSCPAA